MNQGISWSDATLAALQNVWINVVHGIPRVLVALLLFAVGFLVARLVRALVKKIAKPVDGIAERSGLPERIRQGGIRFTLSGFLATLAGWIVMVAALSAIADVLQWDALTGFLRSVVAYTPHVLVALAMIVIGFLAANFLHDFVEGSVRAGGMSGVAAETVASMARVAVILFTAMAALTQLGIASDLIKILFTGIVAALAIGVGLAFGLGGREKASRWLDQLEQSMAAEGGSTTRRARAAKREE